MKKFVLKFVSVFILAVCTFCLTFAAACGQTNGYVLTENTFFMVMTNALYYPEKYVDKDFELDCFIYDLTDINGEVYRLGVRKCSAGYGCNCGKDTIIGFILDYNGALPEPKNQSEDTPDKTWVHLSGKITSSQKTDIKIYGYNAQGELDTSVTETVSFLTYAPDSVTLITDYSGLNYYVTK